MKTRRDQSYAELDAEYERGNMDGPTYYRRLNQLSIAAREEGELRTMIKAGFSKARYRLDALMAGHQSSVSSPTLERRIEIDLVQGLLDAMRVLENRVMFGEEIPSLDEFEDDEPIPDTPEARMVRRVSENIREILGDDIWT